MAGTPATYTRTYTYAGQAKTKIPYGAGMARGINRSQFRLGGNTTEPIGQITKITVEHWHSASGSSGSRPKTWKTRCRMTLPTRSDPTKTPIETQIVSWTFHGENVKYTNTFATDLPTPDEFNSFGQLHIVKVNQLSDSDLYWWATASQPIKITVYFLSARDLVEGEDAPEINGLTVTDNRMVSDTESAMERFGGIVQGRSELTFTGDYEIDRSFDFISAAHTLTVTGSGGDVLFEATQQDNSIFSVPADALTEAGQITAKYTVTDNGREPKSDTLTQTYTVLPYAPPQFTLQPSLERYENDFGTHRPAADGELLWLTLGAAVSRINAQSENDNLWKLTAAWVSDDGESSGSATVYDMTEDGAEILYSLSLTNDESVFGGLTFDSAQGWTFRFTIEDMFEAVTAAEAAIDEAGAFFNVYPGGASVGMRGNGTEDNRLFEVAEDIESRFYGGIEGVNVYTSNEVKTGGRWVNGKPIYRKTVVYTGAMSAGGSYAMPLGIADQSAIAQVVAHSGYAAAANMYMPLPFYHADAAYGIRMTVQHSAANGWHILLALGASRSGVTGAQITVEYAKNE